MEVRRRPTLAVALTQLRTLDCHDAWASDADTIGRAPGRLPPELEDAIEAILRETARSDDAAARAWGLGQSGRTRAVHERPPPIEPTMLLRHVIMTDGEAERPSVRHPERWLWLLTEHGSDAAIRGIGRIVRVRAGT